MRNLMDSNGAFNIETPIVILMGHLIDSSRALNDSNRAFKIEIFNSHRAFD